MSSDGDFRILVIDDNPAIHRDIQKILARDTASTALDEDEAFLFGRTAPTVPAESFAVDAAYQGREALDMIRQAAEENRPYAAATSCSWRRF